MKQKILITGITGFVGSHLADYLLKKKIDCEIHGLKRWHLSNLKNVKEILDRIHLHDCDITDPISVRKLMVNLKPDIIFHCAAESFVSPSWDHPSRYMSVNYNGTLNFLDAIYNIKLDTIFHIPGSGEEYGEIKESELPIRPESVMRPVNPYAVSKIAQDLIGYVYYKSYGVKVIRTRAFNHEGPRREKVFGISWYAYQIAMIESGLMKAPLRVGGIDDRRNFTHVEDIVEAYWLSTQKCQPGELYLIGSEKEDSVFTFRESLQKLFDMSNVKGLSHVTAAEFVRPTGVPRLIADTKKFRDITGWEPKKSFDDILLDTLNYWRSKIKKNEHI